MTVSILVVDDELDASCFASASTFLTLNHPRWIVPSARQKGKPCSVTTAINWPTRSPKAALSPSSECSLAAEPARQASRPLKRGPRSG